MRSSRTKSRRSFLSSSKPSEALNAGLAKHGDSRIERAVTSVIEPLENRMLMTAVVVNSITDTDSAGTVTLRDAITMANSSTTPTTITFDPTVFATAQTIVLGGTQLELSNTTEPTTINGPSAGATVNANGASRVLLIDSGVTATITGLTISGGNASQGGGIESSGTVSLTGVTVSNNSSTVMTDYGSNAGIQNSGDMTLNGVTVSGNSALDDSSVGGIGNLPGATMVLVNSTISGNTGTRNDGGLYNDGSMTMTGVTISDNISGGWAGGIKNGHANTLLEMTDCTITGNTANGSGGGLYNVVGTATLSDVTITGNTATTGGGIDNIATAPTLSNTIVAGNTTTGGGTGPDVAGTFVSDGYNLIGETDGSTGWISSDLTGTEASPVSAGLGSLASNGGPTQTLLPQAGSLAIGHGSVSLIPSGVTTDQRGDPRTINGAVDIGAVEVGGTAAPTGSSLVVNSASDSATGSGVVTLRDAITTANSSTTPTSITFDPTVFATAQTIVLDGTQLELSNTAEPTTITGPASGVTISGDGASRIFLVDSGVTASFSGLTLTDGYSQGSGAAISSSGTTSITDATIFGNTATNVRGNGGGVNVNTGTTTIVNSTIEGNTAYYGGGIEISSGTLNLTNATITGNSANGGYDGGGIGIYGGTAAVGNTIIAGNSVNGGGAGPDVYGAFDSLGNNLIGETDGSSGWVSSDLTGTTASPLSDGLGALASNGGPTETLLPLAGSYAIANGSVSLIPSGVTTDQRGDPRTINGAVDIGAVEVGGTKTVKTLAATVSTLTSTANIFPVGDYCYLTCTVASASGTGPVPTGTISIDQNGVSKATETLVNGTVTFKWTAITAGPSALDNFVYSGDSNYASSTSNTIDQDYPALSQLSANIKKAVIPASNVAGQPLNARVPASFTNTGSILSGTYTVVLYADTSSGGLSGNQVALETVVRHTALRTNRTLSVTLTAKKLPASLTPGEYYLLAEVTDPDGSVNIVNTSQTIAVSAPVVSLAPSNVAVKPVIVAANRYGTVTMTVANNGNISATGFMYITLELSTDGVTPSSSFPSLTTKVRINIPAHKTGKASIRFKVPAALAAGSYYPLVTVSADGSTASAVGSLFSAK